MRPRQPFRRAVPRRRAVIISRNGEIAPGDLETFKAAVKAANDVGKLAASGLYPLSNSQQFDAKARPLTSEKAVTELGELSLHQGPVKPGQLDPLQRKLSREQTMFETRGHALGGSRTADNLADADAMALDPSIVSSLFSGNIGPAIKATIAAGHRQLTGNTAAVREEVSKILLQQGRDLPDR